MTAPELVSAYLRAIESRDPDAIERCLHPDVEVVEHPNRVNPAGARYDLAALREAGARGRALLASERYAVRRMIADGARVAAQIEWTGTLRDGRAMRAQICSVIELRDGLVWRQEQYDCFA